MFTKTFSAGNCATMKMYDMELITGASRSISFSCRYTPKTSVTTSWSVEGDPSAVHVEASVANWDGTFSKL